MKVLALFIVTLMFVSICSAENILLSAATTDKELLLLNIEYANKKFKIVDYAIFKLPFQVGVTALGRLQNGNYQVVWTAQDASKKIKIHSMIFDTNLNKVGNVKKFARVLSSYTNLNILDRNQQTLKAADADDSLVTYDALRIFGEEMTELGNLTGRRKPLFPPSSSFDPFDTALSTADDDGSTYYVSLGSFSSGGNGIVLGDTANSNITSGFVFTGGVVSSIDMLGKAGTDDFYLYGWEQLNNPIRYKMFERVFDGPTGQPVRNQRIVVTTKPGDLGALASFNPFGVLQSNENRKIRFAWWSQEEAGLDGTNLYIKSLSDQDVKEIAQFLNFDFLSSPRYTYAYDGEIMPPPEP